MMRRFTFFTVLLALAFSCGKENSLNLDNSPSDMHTGAAFKTREEINRQALSLLNEHQKFEWSMVDAHTVWSANLLGDSIICIGYQPANEKNVNQRLHQIDIQRKEWKQVREELINYIVEETNRQNPAKTITAKDLMPFGEEAVLPVIDIKITSLGIIEKLRSLPQVRYIEPMGYSYLEERLRSDSGCGVSGNPSIPTADFTNITPAAKQSWHHGVPRIGTAWGNNSGRGITVALLDTGTPDPNSQPKRGSQFNSGFSTVRTLTRR